MRRPFSNNKVRIAIASAFALVVVIAVTLSVRHYQQPQAAPPEALAHIAEKNRDAAVVAAARQRTESAAATSAAESIAEAERRGQSQANAMLARFPDTENRTDAQIQPD